MPKQIQIGTNARTTIKRAQLWSNQLQQRHTLTVILPIGVGSLSVVNQYLRTIGMDGWQAIGWEA